MTTIRVARPRDAPCLASILSDWIDETEWMPRLHSRQEDQSFVQGLISQGGVNVLCDEGRATGFMKATNGHISALYLARNARDQGGGRTLLRAARKAFDRLDLWVFTANEGALRFYRREGFEVIEESADNEEGLHAFFLKWEKRGRADE